MLKRKEEVRPMVNEVMDFITGYDKEVGEAIQAECARQRRNLELKKLLKNGSESRTKSRKHVT